MWTIATENLIVKWKNQISNRIINHKICANRYGKLYYYLGTPVTILDAICATGAYATYSNCKETYSPVYSTNATFVEYAPNVCSGLDEIIRLVLASILVVSVGLSAANVFLEFQKRSVLHKKSADEYEVLLRYIEDILSTDISLRKSSTNILQKIRERYDGILRRAPEINILPDDYLQGGVRPLGCDSSIVSHQRDDISRHDDTEYDEYTTHSQPHPQQSLEKVTNILQGISINP